MSSTFVQDFNPITGRLQWVVRSEEYDYQQEIARSAYGDMLHDDERNAKYQMGLEIAIRKMQSKGRKAKVLDIGTGSGILAMMAVRAGADHVFACEAFQPMAGIARKVMKSNGYDTKIHVIDKRSTELSVGLDGDLPFPVNIVVAEVFDTELIGEGAIETFLHAHKHLMESDSLIVPSRATMYAQIVHYPEWFDSWNVLKPVTVNDTVLSLPEEERCCSGTSLHDLQLSQLARHNWTKLSEPIPVFRFDFNNPKRLVKENRRQIPVSSLAAGSPHLVFMWWDIDMDPDGQVPLSCAPSWAHPDGDKLPWRDHWMQAIYYVRKPYAVQKCETMYLQAFHDEFSLDFDVVQQEGDDDGYCETNEQLPVLIGRTRLAMLNDEHRLSLYIAALKKLVRPQTVCLSICESSLLPFVAKLLGARKVFSAMDEKRSSRMMQSLNGCLPKDQRVHFLWKNADEVKAEEMDDEKIDLVLAEPWFSRSHAPWHDLFFWYSRSAVQRHLKPNAKVMPSRAILRAVVMEFDHLWKIRAPVGSREGLSIERFDEVIMESHRKTEDPVEPQPLWEYDGRALSRTHTLMEFDLSAVVPDQDLANQVRIPVQSNGRCCGVALWMDYVLVDDIVVSTGSHSPPEPGQPVDWLPYYRQSVHLFPEPAHVSEGKNVVHVSLQLRVHDGNMNIHFNVE